VRPSKRRLLLAIMTTLCATAGTMAIAALGMEAIEIVGPRPGVRIATLVPQIELTALFLVSMYFGTRPLKAKSTPAFRTALAATSHGCSRLIWGTSARQLLRVALVLASGTVVWACASAVGLGPSLGDILKVRALLLAIAAFGIGFAVWSRVVWPQAPAAGLGCALVLAMAATSFLVAPLVAVMGPRPLLVQASMLCNPWIITAGISRLDFLHMQWIYALSPLGRLETSYPALATAVLAYGGTGTLLLCWAARALHTPPR